MAKTVIAVPEGHHVEIHPPGAPLAHQEGPNLGNPMIAPVGQAPGVGPSPAAPGVPGVIPTPALDGAKAAMDQALAVGDPGKSKNAKPVPKLKKKKKQKHPTGAASALAQGSADAAAETPDSDEG